MEVTKDIKEYAEVFTEKEALEYVFGAYANAVLVNNASVVTSKLPSSVQTAISKIGNWNLVVLAVSEGFIAYILREHKDIYRVLVGATIYAGINGILNLVMPKYNVM